MQITYLIFLKMADEREQTGQQVRVPDEFAWSRLVKLDGDDLELQYRHTLENLGKQGGMLGTIFGKAQNKIDAGHPWSLAALRAPNFVPDVVSGDGGSDATNPACGTGGFLLAA